MRKKNKRKTQNKGNGRVGISSFLIHLLRDIYSKYCLESKRYPPPSILKIKKTMKILKFMTLVEWEKLIYYKAIHNRIEMSRESRQIQMSVSTLKTAGSVNKLTNILES